MLILYETNTLTRAQTHMRATSATSIHMKNYLQNNNKFKSNDIHLHTVTRLIYANTIDFLLLLRLHWLHICSRHFPFHSFFSFSCCFSFYRAISMSKWNIKRIRTNAVLASSRHQFQPHFICYSFQLKTISVDVSQVPLNVLNYMCTNQISTDLIYFFISISNEKKSCLNKDCVFVSIN